MTALTRFIRDVPDFPKPGITFKDITTLIGDPAAFAQSIQELSAPFRTERIDKIVCIESRGFLFGTPIALELNAGIVPLRKPGKLPYETIRHEYELEYGTDALEMHVDAIEKGDRVLIVDDLLATGGTAEAAAALVTKMGGIVESFVFLIELSFLNGRSKLGGHKVHCLIDYDGE